MADANLSVACVELDGFLVLCCVSSILVFLEELYSTSDLGVIKREIVELVSKQEHKQVNLIQ